MVGVVWCIWWIICFIVVFGKMVCFCLVMLFLWLIKLVFIIKKGVSGDFICVFFFQIVLFKLFVFVIDNIYGK